MEKFAFSLIMLFLAIFIAMAGFVFADARDAQKTFLSYCNYCHPPDRALQAVKSEESWRLTIERMGLQYEMFTGGKIPLVDQELILEYLVREAGGNQGVPPGN